MDPSLLPIFWAGLIAFAILVYVVLDGFDLGVGILFGTTRREDRRSGMLAAIAPVWDGNETWLILVGASLFGAFPVVYAVFLSAFYLPVALLLFALIFRGVAFEFRHRAERMRGLWDWGFFSRILDRRLRARSGDRQHGAGTRHRGNPLRRRLVRLG